MDLAPGRLVTSNVRLLRPLREGGMGLVWIAEHLTLKTQVAVKFISAQLLEDDPEICARFENEASLAAQIKSEHVVHTYDQGLMDDGTPYIVMELLDGNTLTDWVELEGALDLHSVVVLITQVAKALQRAHRLGIVHRDIKADNIFLVDTDETEDPIFAKILDFGIAKHTKLPDLDMGTKPGTIVGTPEFMSPEQMLAEGPVDLRADLWALAVVAYYSLTGRIPFEAKTLVKLCLAVLDGTFQPPSVHNSTVPATVDQWFDRALNREPEARFPSAKEMAVALQYAAGLALEPGRSEPGTAEATTSGAWGSLADEQSNPGLEPPRARAVIGTDDAEGLGTMPTISGASSPVPEARRRRRGPRVMMGVLAAGAALAAGVGVAMFMESEQLELPGLISSSSPPAAPTALPEPSAAPTAEWDLPDGALPSDAILPPDTVLVPAGEFSMGCERESDADCQPDERPLHAVQLSAFVIDRLEISVARYMACVRAGRCTTEGLDESKLCNWKRPDRFDQPINCVDWHQANGYCDWVGMRLPTEAEWEKAARGEEGRSYPWGDDEPSCEHSVMDEGGDGCGRDSTWPVGSKAGGASPYGVLDLAGNVWEWVADRYDERYYARSPLRDPPGPPAGTSRSMRGGSWLSAESADLRAATRHASHPGHRNYNLGFRCAGDAGPDAVPLDAPSSNEDAGEAD